MDAKETAEKILNLTNFSTYNSAAYIADIRSVVQSAIDFATAKLRAELACLRIIPCEEYSDQYRACPFCGQEKARCVRRDIYYAIECICGACSEFTNSSGGAEAEWEGRKGE